MRSFLVESYAGRAEDTQLGLLTRRARAAETEVGGVRHLGSILLPVDEICLHVFAAPSAAALEEATRVAGLVHDRVVEAVWIPPIAGGE